MSDAEPTATEVGLQPEPPAKPSRGRAIGLAIGAVAVVAGGAFAAMSLSGDESNSPEDPVRAVLEAIEQGDVLGVLEQFEPGERDALRGPMTELVDELNRLEVLEGASLEDLQGVEVSFEDVELASEAVADDVAHVTIEGGRGRFAFDPSELPIGDFLDDLIGDELDEAEAIEGEEAIASEDGDDFVATVKRDGRWYVSLGYTFAEMAREGLDVAFDAMEPGVQAEGAGSPEDAVRELITAATELDLRRVITLLPPGEMGALQRYAGLFLDDAEDAIADFGEQIEVEVGDLDLRVDEDGDSATVFVSVDSFAAAFSDGEITYEDGCIRYLLPGEPEVEQCAGGDPTEFLEQFGFGGMEDVEPPQLSFADDPPEIGVVVTEVDGRWFVSPIRTSLDSLVETLSVMERADLDEIRRYVEDLFASFTGGMESFSSDLESDVLQSEIPAPEGY